MTKSESKKDDRPLSQVIYDIFGYSPGGGMRQVGTTTFTNAKGEECEAKAYAVTIKPQPDDPDFARKVSKLNSELAGGKLACKTALFAEVIGDNSLDNIP